MVPLRDHLSLATPALVLVVPVVAGTVVGGFGAGLVAVVVGFLAYDFFFIPPYGTLSRGAAQDWDGPGRLRGGVLVWCRCWSTACGGPAPKRAGERRSTRRIYLLSELLIGDRASTSCWPRSSPPSTGLRAPAGRRSLLPEADRAAGGRHRGGAAHRRGARAACCRAPGRTETAARRGDDRRGPDRAHRPGPAGGPGGHGRHRRSTPTAGSSSPPTPTRRPSLWSGAGCASRWSGPNCSRKSTAGVTPSWARSPTTCGRRWPRSSRR